MITEKWIDVGGIRTRYLEEGSGPHVIVFIHDGAFLTNPFCSNAYAWEFNLAGLSADFRVIAFDTLGQGATDRPQNDHDLSIDGMIAHAQRFLLEVGAHRAHIVGHGEGGMIGLRLAFEDPASIASCTIVDSPSVAPSGDSVPNTTLASPLQPLYSSASQRWVLDRQSLNDAHIASGRYLNEAMRLASDANFYSIRQQNEQHQIASRINKSLSRLKGNNFTRFREAGVPVPILLVWGMQDPMSPVMYARSLYHLIAARQRRAHFRLINDSGYFPFRERPDAFNATLSGFVRASNASQPEMLSA